MSIQKDSKSSSLRIIKVRLGKDTFKIDVSKELKIDYDDLEDGLIKQPLNYGFVCMVFQKCVEMLKLYKLEMEGRYAELYTKYKSKTYNGKYLTKEEVESKIKLDTKYKLMLQRFISLEYNKGRVEDLKRSLEQKKDILQTLSATKRKEM